MSQELNQKLLAILGGLDGVEMDDVSGDVLKELYFVFSDIEKRIEAKFKELKKVVIDYVKENGEEDDNGNQFVVCQNGRRLTLVPRDYIKILEEDATTLLGEKSLIDEATTRTFDKGKIEDLFVGGKITESELKSMLSVNQVMVLTPDRKKKVKDD